MGSVRVRAIVTDVGANGYGADVSLSGKRGPSLVVESETPISRRASTNQLIHTQGVQNGTVQ